MQWHDNDFAETFRTNYSVCLKFMLEKFGTKFIVFFVCFPDKEYHIPKGYMLPYGIFCIIY